MYEVLSSFKHNPTQNCNNNSSILKNPKTYVSKQEKHEEWEIRSLPREENLEKAWRNLEKQD